MGPHLAHGVGHSPETTEAELPLGHVVSLEVSVEWQNIMVSMACHHLDDLFDEEGWPTVALVRAWRNHPRQNGPYDYILLAVPGSGSGSWTASGTQPKIDWFAGPARNQTAEMEPQRPQPNETMVYLQAQGLKSSASDIWGMGPTQYEVRRPLIAAWGGGGMAKPVSAHGPLSFMCPHGSLC